MPRQVKTQPESIVLGQLLRELRTEKQWSQERFAEESGVHRNYVGGVERGEIVVSFTHLLRLAAALGVPASDLVRRYEERAAAAGGRAR